MEDSMSSSTSWWQMMGEWMLGDRDEMPEDEANGGMGDE